MTSEGQYMRDLEFLERNKADVSCKYTKLPKANEN